VLQRLRTANDIRAALEDLPETLDETYERILGLISSQDRKIARMALCFLCAKEKLPGPGVDHIYHNILIPLVFDNWDYRPEVPHHLFSDLETLKDVCGCLITVLDVKVSLAHFTVEEFLFSRRLQENKNSAISFFALSWNTCKTTVMAATLRGAINYIEPHTPIKGKKGLFNLLDDLLMFGVYMVMSWEREVIQAGLQNLVFEFLNPTAAHYRQFYGILPKYKPPKGISKSPDALTLEVLKILRLHDLAKIFCELKGWSEEGGNTCDERLDENMNGLLVAASEVRNEAQILEEYRNLLRVESIGVVMETIATRKR
jgi:hypothetical protein